MFRSIKNPYNYGAQREDIIIICLAVNFPGLRGTHIVYNASRGSYTRCKYTLESKVTNLKEESRVSTGRTSSDSAFDCS